MPPCPQPRQTSALPLPRTHPAPPALAHPFSALQGARAGQRRRQYRRWCQPTARGSGGYLPGSRGLHLTPDSGAQGEPGDLAHYLCDSKIKAVNFTRLTFFLLKWSCCGPCLRPAVDRKGLQGSLTTKGPVQMIPSPGWLSPQDYSSKQPSAHPYPGRRRDTVRQLPEGLLGTSRHMACPNACNHSRRKPHPHFTGGEARPRKAK